MQSVKLHAEAMEDEVGAAATEGSRHAGMGESSGEGEERGADGSASASASASIGQPECAPEAEAEGNRARAKCATRTRVRPPASLSATSIAERPEVFMACEAIDRLSERLRRLQSRAPLLGGSEAGWRERASYAAS